MGKASDNIFPKVITAMQTTDPSAPSDSSWKVYAKAGGIYARSSNGITALSGASGAITGSGLTMATSRLLGRTTASTGAIEEISVGSGLTLSGGSLSASGGGTSYGQSPVYPTSFSGNDDNMTATTNWVDTSAFDTKEILDSTVLHLKTLGASKDQRVRYTLGTTRAGAFDLVFGSVLHGGVFWSSDVDTYAEILGSTSGGTVLFIIRILNKNSSLQQLIRVGGTSVVTTNHEPIFTHLPTTFRVVRDGSNNVTFFYTHGAAPVALQPIVKASDAAPYSVSSSGTLARIELAIHTPSGPGGSAQWDLWLDYLKDNS